MTQRSHRTARHANRNRDRFTLTEVEPRVLYSADAASLFAAAIVLPDEATEVQTALIAQQGINGLGSSDSVEQSTSDRAAEETAIELVIIDRSLEDSDWIADQLAQQNAPNRVIAFLDSDRDGIDQLSELIASHESISAIHLFSHGQQAELQLGSTRLDTQALLQNADQISEWSRYLTSDADLLIYGCDLVGSSAGINYATTLSQLTGADVAASDDVTGAVALGGDWQLEFRTGSIETSDSLGSELLDDYASTLATSYVVSDFSDSGVNTLRWAIEQANGDGEDSTITFASSGYISLQSQLPEITSRVTIDGTGHGNSWPDVTLDGTNAGAADALILSAGSDGSEIFGLAIRHFARSGIFIDNSDSNTIYMMDIGSDGDASNDYGNGWYGIEISNSSYNKIGSQTPLLPGNPERILISGNGLSGIGISGAASIGNEINNTLIGISWAGGSIANGTASSGQAGIHISNGASDTTIGTFERNVISGNSGDGIRIAGSGTTGTVVANNYIGVFYNGTTAIANTGHGVNILSSSSDNTIGGLTSDDDNLIANNGADGIRIDGNDSDDNSLLRNSIYDNAGHSISLGGVMTSNDAGDVDTGANQQQNYPVLTSVTTNAVDRLYLSATLHSQANSDYRLEFFATDSPDASGYGGATEYIGSATVTTDASGNATINGTFVTTIAVGTEITATATEWHGGGNYGNTSQFSLNVQAQRTNEDPVFTSTDNFAMVENGTSAGTVTVSDGDGDTPTFSIVATQDHSLFSIDSASGLISFNSAPDHEAPVDANADNFYEITVQADDGYGGIVTQQVTIQVVDQNEYSTTTVIDSNASSNRVNENSANGTTVGITGSATDSDGTDTVTYSLTDNAGGLFTIDSNSGVVTVAGALDHETDSSHNIEVTATSSDGSMSSRTFIIHVEDVNEAAVTAVSDSDVTGNHVDEDASVGTTVGITGSATDSDGTDTVTYSLTDNAGGLFSIDSNTGVVTVAGALDHETDSSHNIEITATSSDGSTSSQTFFILVADINESAVGAVSDIDFAANQVDEDATVGTVVRITAAASDPDGTDSVTYSLTDSAGGLFNIGSSSGVVTVAGALDHEADTSHSIEVTATSSDGSTSNQTFTIQVADVNESAVGAITDSDLAANQVDEDASVGTAVGITGTATDSDGTDTITYSLTDSAGGLFSIDSNSGVVTVAGALDHETDSSHSIEITATSSDGSTSSQTFVIQVADVNESAVGAVSDSDLAVNQVDEDASVGTTVGITGSANDPDGTDTITYSLTDSAGGLFSIDSNSGVVTVAGALDHEADTSHSIEVTATSSDGSTSNQTFTIQVADVNESAVGAVTDSDLAANQVDEDASVGTAVGITGAAADPDGTDAVAYSLTDNAGGLFSIDSNTGVVTVAGALDHENANNHSIEITATSSDGSTSSQTFIIQIADVNEAAVGTVSDIDFAANQVDEDATVGTVVRITAAASDPDGTDSVTYSLTDSAGGLFNIGSSSGVVTVAGALDHETSNNHSIEITATSSDGSTSSQTFVIQVADINEAAVDAVTDSDLAANQVDEDASVGTAVGITGTATDPDGTDTVAYSLTDNAGGLFSIDSNTGVVTVAGALDHESAGSHNIEITATSSDGSTSSQTFVIQVADINEAAVGAVTDSDLAINQVDEDASVGTAVGITGAATDPDGTDTVAYSLTDSAGGLFSIDSNSGVVTVAGALDHETDSSHSIEITATSSDGSTASQTFVIQVADVNEAAVGAVTDSDLAANQVDEDASVGTTVGITGSANDPDGTDNVMYSLTDSSGGLFSIDSNSGVVTVAGALDHEADTSHSIEVTATSSDGSTSNQTFTIQVADVNESAVGAISDSDLAVNQVDEDASVGTAVGITGTATDPDGTDTVAYSLTDNAGGLFSIDSNTGVVTVAGALDHESAGSHNIEITATSSDGSTSSQTFIIQIADVNEAAVGTISDIDFAANQVDEDATIGTVVRITAAASDPDGTDSVTYSLTDSAGGLFSIDSNTGVVTVAGALDHENASSHSIEITATSSDGSTSSQTFIIQVVDVNESAVGAITDSDVAANQVDENASVGTAVGVTGAANDPDGTDTVTYSLTDSAGGLFSIDSNSGVVTVAGALDHEADTSHSIEVTATSSDGSTSNQTFTIQVADVNESAVGAITDSDVAANQVDENASVGTAVGVTGAATDPDGTDNVTYSLTDSSGGLFTIDSNSGVITVNGALNHEADTSHSIEVTATSSDGSTSNQTFIIQVADVNESAVSTVTDSDIAVNQVDEDASVGTTVGITGSANDPDGTDTVTYSLTDSAGGLFIIDSNSGVVTVAGALDHETSNDHSIEITATSSDGSTSSQTFVIQVADINEAAVGAVTDSDLAINQVDEDASVGTAVRITGAATDPDGTDTVAYSLTDSAGGLFSIDSNSGVVTVAGGLDHETNSSHSIEVTATSSDGSTSSQTFVIQVADVNEAAVGAVTDSDLAVNQVDEDASAGTAVGITGTATDPDSTDTVAYSLTDSAGGLFTIDSNSGVITVAGALDHENASSHSIEITATSSDGSTSSQTFIIQVVDVNESAVGAITDSDVAANQVDEDASVGTAVGITGTATDPDGTDTVAYSLTDNAGGLFSIDSNSGVVTVAGGLDHETNSSHSIEVTATSSDGSTSSQTFVIQVADVNESAVSSVSDSDPGVNQIDEDASVGTTVGITGSAADPDGTDTVTYSLTDSAGGLFSIDSNSGVVTVANALDHETDSSHNIEITATSSDGSTSSQTFIIQVVDVNESAVGAVTDNDVAVNQVDEDSSVGTTVGITGTATDPDGTATVTYSLTDSAGGLFSIDSNSGVVTVAGVLDHESTSSHNIEITATSSDGSTSSQTFIIQVADVNESAVGAVIDSDVAVNQVDENSSVGTAVGITGTATDPDGNDTVTYSLTDSAGGLFSIDSYTGVVTVAGALDHEVETSHSIEVTATSSDGSTSSQTFTIQVADVNESAVSAVSDTDLADNQVDEDASVGTTVGITGTATDPDGTDTVTYSLTDRAGGLFSIDSNTGVVTVAGALDHEVENSHSIEVTATSSDGSTSSQTFTIQVADVNESVVGAVSDSDLADNQVDEDASVGTTVGITGAATDPDGTDSVTYSLTDNANGLFSIDSNTGVVTVANALDHETANSHSIEVTATSGDGSISRQTFNIQVEDVNESSVTAIVDIDAEDNRVDADVSAGTAVGISANASDEDASDSVTYALANSAGGRFSIDAETGLISTAIALNTEATGSHQIEVLATSSDGSSSSRVFTITINAIEQAPEITSTQAFSIAENTTLAGSINANSETSDSVVYTITGGSDAAHFSINTLTGELSFGSAPDYELPADTNRDNHYELTVSATADGMSSEQQIRVSVTDVNEQPVIEVVEMQSTSSYAGTIGKLNITDPDTGDQVQLTIVGGDAAQAFRYDADTREVSQVSQLEAGTHTLEVLVTDSAGNTVPATLTIVILGDPVLGAAQSTVTLEHLVSNQYGHKISEIARETESTAFAAISSYFQQVKPEQRPEAESEPSMSIEVEESGDQPAHTTLFEDVFSVDQLNLSAQDTADQELDSAVSISVNGGVHTSDSQTGNEHARLLQLLDSIQKRTMSITPEMVDKFQILPFQLSLKPMTSSDSDLLSEELAESVREHQNQQQLVVAVGTGASIALTAGFVSWMLKAGVLISAARTSAPLWGAIDPIPILRNRDGKE